MNKNKKGIFNILIISLVVLFLVTIGGADYYLKSRQQASNLIISEQNQPQNESQGIKSEQNQTNKKANIIKSNLEGLNLISISDSNFGYTYEKDRKCYANINDKQYGPYDHRVTGLSLSGNNFGFAYLKNGKWFFNINDREYGPYDYYDLCYEKPKLFDSNGQIKDCPIWIYENSFAFKYKIKNKWFLNINDKEYGPYDDIHYVSVSNNAFGFGFEKEDAKYYININDKEYGPYDYGEPGYYPYFVSVGGRGFIFGYMENDKYYVNINDKEYGPYDYGVYEGVVFDNNFGFRYKEGDELYGNWYTNINGQIYGPYAYVSNLVISKHTFAFRYQNNKNYKMYANINEQVYGPYELVYGPLISENNFMFSYKNFEKWYVNVSDQIYGPYEYMIQPNFVLFDENFAFIRGTNNEEKYIIFNGKEFGPYDNVYSLLLSKDIFSSGYYLRNDNSSVSSFVEINFYNQK